MTKTTNNYKNLNKNFVLLLSFNVTFTIHDMRFNADEKLKRLIIFIDLIVLLSFANCFEPAKISPFSFNLKPTLRKIDFSIESPTILPLTFASPWQLSHIHHVSTDALVILIIVATSFFLSFTTGGGSCSFGNGNGTVPSTFTSSAVNVPVLSKQQIVTIVTFGVIAPNC